LLQFQSQTALSDRRRKNQDLIVIVKPSVIGEWLNMDEKVTVSFSPEKAHLFKYPETGLKEEMAVE